MNAQQLKNSILQMAVQGKLVPQDPSDEPASVLLGQIRAEKEKLIKEGKIKKEKNPSYIFRGEDNLPYEKVGKNEPVCIADEVPFEIPDSWEWARLGSICTKLVDGDHNPPKGIDTKSQYLMASSTNINNDSLVELDKVRYLSESVFEKENERTKATAGDIFFTSVGSLGRSCIYDGSLNICFQRSVSVITTLLYNHYLKVFFDSGYFQSKVIKEATGTAQKGFYLNLLAASLIPVPPMEEQKRIVDEIQKYYPYIKEYEAKKCALDELTVSFPELLKKSILQQAVMGKLAPQNPNDEPASVLLDRIRAEKDALIKAGKLKKDKHESIIYRRDNSHYEKLNGVDRCIDDEIPFDIPDSWSWCRLGILGDTNIGLTYKPSDKIVSGGVLVLRSSNIQEGIMDYSDCVYVSCEIPERAMIHKGDILICARNGSRSLVGKCAIVDKDGMAFGAFMAKFQSSYNPYIKLFLDSPLFRNQLDGVKTETINQITQDMLKNQLIPIPPICEQERIINEVNRLIPHLTKL